ncbi:MAG: permease [Alphaproteobacteria bacterium]|nr:permease [Alphaproteobacteria bacterium]
MQTSCCNTGHDHGQHKTDFLFYGTSAVILAALALYFVAPDLPYIHHFGGTVLEMLSTMWWGVLLGIFFVGLMGQVPREYFQAIMGRGDSAGGILRAVIAGIFLDLCSHGIVLVAAKLYERGISTAQIVAFLIASPWNSLSLTLILVSLIGLQWTLVFIAGSVLVAFITGFAYMALVKNGTLPANPHTTAMPEDFNFWQDARTRLKNFRPDAAFFKNVFRSGLSEGRMLVRWLLLGIIIAAAARTFIPADDFALLFGPTMLGLLITLAAATVIEVCSEGSVPIASEIMKNAAAPGNAFTFLMAGVSTDYTEIMILRQATGSWKIPLFLPLLTVPQIVLLGWLMNQ